MTDNGTPEFKLNSFGFRTSQAIEIIAEALVAAQAEFGQAIKDSANPAYRSKYADLSSCIEATQKALSKHGIAVMQAPQLDAQMVTITTRLQHKSGQWYESDLTLPAVQRERFDAQSVGSAITYGRRYSLQSILNLATADDDGNSASGVGTHEAAQAVGKAKVEDLTGKLKQSIKEAKEKKANGGYVTSLFYTWDSNLQKAEITGDEGLKTANKDLLKAFWSPVAKAILVTDEQLEGLKFSLGERGVPFTQLKEANRA